MILLEQTDRDHFGIFGDQTIRVFAIFTANISQHFNSEYSNKFVREYSWTTKQKVMF